MTTTRLGSLVVQTVSSCLGDMAMVGIDDRADGSKN